jgi:hypothetical protein
MNLRPRWNDNEPLGMPLGALMRGGSYINYDCRISPDESQLPYVNPMYIREGRLHSKPFKYPTTNPCSGAIIPQIEVRQSVPDRSRFPNEPAIPVTINVYPGKDRVNGLYKDEVSGSCWNDCLAFIELTQFYSLITCTSMMASLVKAHQTTCTSPR